MFGIGLTMGFLKWRKMKNRDIVWAEDRTGKVIFIQSFDPVKEYEKMLDAYRKFMMTPKVKVFKMPLQELIIDVRIDTPL